MSDLRLFVFTRFGLGITDPLWFEHRIKLLSAITAPSLAAQSDQGFTWIIQTNEKLPEQISSELDQLVSMAGTDSRVVPVRRSNVILALARRLGPPDSGECCLTGRIDDDDAWHPETVALIRRFASSWLGQNVENPGASWSFSHGLEWLMYDMTDFHSGQELTAGIRDMHLAFTSISVFVLAARTADVSALSAGHTAMRRVLGERGFDVNVIDTKDPMWLYSRHKQADSVLVKADGVLRQPSEDQIKQFGIDGELLRAYREYAESAPYVVEKKLMRRRRELMEQLQQSPGDDEIEERLHRLSATVTQR